MFGKIRCSSSSSLESLESQRLPSKLLKEDSLSIYEATLVKLRLGSQRRLTQLSNELGDIDNGGLVSPLTCVDPMKIEPSTSCATTSQGSPDLTTQIDTDCYPPAKHPSRDERDERRPGSIIYLFSKFKSAHQLPVGSLSPDLKNDAMEIIGCSSLGRGSLDGMECRSEQDFGTSVSVGNL